MKSAKRFPVLILGLCFASNFTFNETATHAHPALQKEKNQKSTVPVSAMVSDRGKFRITLDGQVVGNEEFEISPSGQTWMARGSMTAHAPGGGDVKATGQLKLTPD